MLKAALLSIFVVALPSVFALVDPAVKFNVYNSEIGCGWGVGGDSYSYDDGGCKPLHKDLLDVKFIANTCRVFVYGNKDCTGLERQVGTGSSDDCRDISYYYSIKAFCN